MGFGLYGLDIVNDHFVAKWDCDWDHIDKFSVSWQVYNSDRWDQIGSTDITNIEEIYGVDGKYVYTVGTSITDIMADNPNAITFRIYVKPVAKTWYNDENGNPVPYWSTGDGEPSQAQYNLKITDLPPLAPPDSYTICEFKTPGNKTLLTVGYEGLINSNNGINSVRASQIEYVLYEYPNTTPAETKTVIIESGVAETTFQLEPGKSYQIKARSKEGNNYSSYNAISERIYTIPAAPTGLSARVTNTSTSLNLSYVVNWNSVYSATSYEIEIAQNREYFDVNGMTESETVELPTYTKIGVNGGEYFFRVRAINNSGESEWSTIEPLIIGKAPLAPTTWTTDTIYTIGDTINFYWKHLSKDGTREYVGQIDIMHEDTTHEYHTVSRENQNEEDWGKNNVYNFSTSGIVRSERLVYRVRTAGVTMQYGEWSEPKEIMVYAVPESRVSINLVYADEHDISYMPINIRAESYDYHNTSTGQYTMSQETTEITMTITANGGYIYQDYYGNMIRVKAGDVVYKKSQLPSGATSSVFTHQLTYDELYMHSSGSYTLKVEFLFESGMSTSVETILSPYFFPEIVSTDASVEMLQDPYIAKLKAIIVPFGNTSVLSYTYDAMEDVMWQMGGLDDYGEYVVTDNAITTDEQFAVLDGMRVEINSQYEFKIVGYTLHGTTFSDPVVLHDYSSTPYTFQEATYVNVAVRPKQTSDDEEIEADLSHSGKIGFYKLTGNNYQSYSKYQINYYRRERNDEYVLIDSHPYTYDYVHDRTLPIITDPHPTLNGSNYRIVVINTETGENYSKEVYGNNDCPFPIIQWDEEWKSWSSNLSTAWTGSYIKMLYNLSQDESNIVSTAEVQYAGRRYKSHYYGNSYESEVTWNADIPKSDEETLFSLRRLAMYPGDVYVREPSGTGYWAHVEVSITREAENVVIPVSIKIKRTDGGI